MIPVVPKGEPADFDVKVRQKGLAWLAAHAIAPNVNATPAKRAKFPAYWSHSNKQLWDSYSGTCAYLAIFFEWVTGASSTDHFVAKSRSAGAAFEWSNYRLSCLGANRNKNKFDDVLDPFTLTHDTFQLVLATGRIVLEPSLAPVQKSLARKTIVRLKLNSSEHKLMRAKHYNRYLQHRHAPTLKELSPFVWYEANRQGLL